MNPAPPVMRQVVEDTWVGAVKKGEDGQGECWKQFSVVSRDNRRRISHLLAKQTNQHRELRRSIQEAVRRNGGPGSPDWAG
jgi:hypothetical protein